MKNDDSERVTVQPRIHRSSFFLPRYSIATTELSKGADIMDKKMVNITIDDKHVQVQIGRAHV